jgi:hypothetical protein
MKIMPTRILYCGDTIYYIEHINSGDPPEISEFDITSYRRLITNLGQRLYDTPVNIEKKIIPLGAYSARLVKILKTCVANPTIYWRPSEDDALALAILRKSIRWRIQEPELLYTMYDYLVSTIAVQCPSKSDTYYTAGKLTKHAWFNTILEKYFQSIVSVYTMEPTHLKGLQAALLTGTPSFSL